MFRRPRQFSLILNICQRQLMVESKIIDNGVDNPNVVDIFGITHNNASELITIVDSNLSTSDLNVWAWCFSSEDQCQLTQTILDTGCDWSVVALGWHVLHEHDELFQCQGAFFVGEDISCQLVDVVTILTFPMQPCSSVLVQANRVLFHEDPGQIESLLDPIQLQSAGGDC